MTQPSTSAGVEIDYRALYSDLVRTYVDTSDERILLEVSALGRALVSAHTPPEVIGELHHRALTDLARNQPNLTLGQANELVTEPMMELLIAYGMDFRERLDSKEQALQETVSELRRANLAKRQFLANMSHEIRTPLNGVIGVSWLLGESGLNDEQREYMRLIIDSGEALRDIVDDILDYSKIEANQLVLERHPFVLRECIESALGVVASRAQDKGLTLGYSIARDVPRTIVGDVTRVRQVLLNLLSNAIKFTKHGEIAITVSMDAPARCDDTGCHRADLDHVGPEFLLSFSVADSGIGIAQDRMGTIFESFRQADESTTRQYGGTGLGLAICQQLAALMGGTMDVDSELGSGSTFCFSICTRAVNVPVPLYERRFAQVWRDRPILLVTECAAYRRMLVEWADIWRVQVHIVGSVADALARCATRLTVQAVIVDADVAQAELFVEQLGALAHDGHQPIVPIVVLRGIGSDVWPRSGPVNCRFLTAPLSMPSVHAALSRQHAQSVAAGSEPTGGDVAAQASADHGADHGDDHASLQVLVVEDNPINRKLAVATLERLGYTADCASTGLEAVQAVTQRRYDLVFMDIQMPVMNGVDATREIRSVLTDEQQPIIVALTANVTSDDRPKFRAAGMNGYLGKPWKVDDLLDVLEAAGRHRGTRSGWRLQVGAGLQEQPARAGSSPSPVGDEADKSGEPPSLSLVPDLRRQTN